METEIIMKGILWSFNKKYTTMHDFIKDLLKYNKSILDEHFHFDFNRKVIDFSEVIIQYNYWDKEINDLLEPDFELKADNNNFFTQGELLYKVNNIVSEKLSEMDNKFFEGFQLYRGVNPNYPNIPLYFLLQGS